MDVNILKSLSSHTRVYYKAVYLFNSWWLTVCLFYFGILNLRIRNYARFFRKIVVDIALSARSKSCLVQEFLKRLHLNIKIESWTSPQSHLLSSSFKNSHLIRFVLQMSLSNFNAFFSLNMSSSFGATELEWMGSSQNSVQDYYKQKCQV